MGPAIPIVTVTPLSSWEAVYNLCQVQQAAEEKWILGQSGLITNKRGLGPALRSTRRGARWSSSEGPTGPGRRRYAND